MGILEDLKQQYKLGGLTEKLIYWNIALFAIPMVVFGILSLFSIQVGYLNYVSLSSSPADLLYQPWTLFTYFFFHSGVIHLLVNVLMLSFISRLFQTFFTQKQMLSVYLMGGLFAGIIYLVSYYVFPALQDKVVSLVGASGAIMAILFAVTSYAPRMNVRLLLIGTVQLWQIALVFIIIDFIQLPLQNTGGHLAHLGGALFGYIYGTQLKKGIDITRGFTKIVDALVTVFFSKKNTTPFKKVHRNTVKPKSAVNKATAVVKKDKNQQQIDEILDKISQSGYDSLTKEEKEFLFNSGK